MELKRSAGVLLHPTSFPSRYGIGDLGKEAYGFLDFLKGSRQKLWQILPLGPTSYGDSPYQSFSTFAGNTLLISPDQLVAEGYLTQDQIAHVPDFPEAKVDYGAVYDYKKDLFSQAFEGFKTNACPKQKKYYNRFCKENVHWLEDYALFLALKWHFITERKREGAETKAYKAYVKKNKKYMTETEMDDCYFGGVWNSWEEGLANREPEVLKKWQTQLKAAIDQEKFLQFEFFRQWGELKAYAKKADIQIIGDIPIFVSLDSADVWVNKSLFFLDKGNNPSVVAGVPPDYFSETGQLWGNPLYDWSAHKGQGYQWWIDRVSACLKVVDIIRIDHFRGFESYWAVKFGAETAMKGKWEKGVGAELFHYLQKALGESLPIIAEDLGIITPEVEALRDELNLPGMKILQFSFGGEDNNAYLPHNLNTTQSVIYTGTHDNDTTVGWYDAADEKTADHFRRYLNSSGDSPAYDMMRLAYGAVSAYCIIPLQDVLEEGTESRMNTPGVGAGNWQYRYQRGALNAEQMKKLGYLVALFNR